VTQLTFIEDFDHFALRTSNVCSSVTSWSLVCALPRRRNTRITLILCDRRCCFRRFRRRAGSRELESKLIFASHNSGSILYRQGEKPKGIFLVVAGRVKMTANALNEKTALLKMAGPGEVLGLASMLSQTPHLTTSQATEPSFVALLRGDALLDGMQRYPQFSLAVAQYLAAEGVENASEALLLRVPCPRAQRLATALLRLADGNGAVHHPRALIYTHAELGQLIGASRETVTRLMKKLETKGVITARKSRFRIRERQLLQQIAGLDKRS